MIPLIYVKAGGYVADKLALLQKSWKLLTDKFQRILDAKDLNSFDAGLVFGLGVKMRKLEIEGGFDRFKEYLQYRCFYRRIDFDVDPSNIDMKNAVKVGVTHRF